MKNYKFTIKTFALLLGATLIFASCNKDLEIDTSFVIYETGEKLAFSGEADKTYNAEVEIEESGYAILKFGGELPDLHIQSDGHFVKHWMDLGEVSAPHILGFREDINGNGPNGFDDFG